jgi:hypothetical protein
VREADVLQGRCSRHELSLEWIGWR